MAAPSLKQMREGLAQNLRDAYGSSVQVSPRMLAAPSPRTIQVYGGKTTFDQAMSRGLDEWTFIVQALVGMVDDIGSSEKLDEFRDPNSPTSVKRAIEKPDAAPDGTLDALNPVRATLGGLVASVQVTEMSEERIYTVAGVDVIGCDFTVLVRAPGK